MSTNSLIAMQNTDGTVSAIYCHWDGDEVGATLAKHYGTPERARALIELGDLSQLAARLAPDPDEVHSYEKPARGVTVAYHRDRGEEFSPSNQFGDTAEFWQYARDDQFPWAYLLTPDGWQVNSEPLAGFLAPSPMAA